MHVTAWLTWSIIKTNTSQSPQVVTTAYTHLVLATILRCAAPIHAQEYYVRIQPPQQIRAEHLPNTG
jgi:hypothetical protein